MISEIVPASTVRPPSRIANRAPFSSATGVISSCIAFRHQHLKKTPEEIAEYLAKIPNADRRERTRQAIELGVDSPQFPDAIKRFEKTGATVPWGVGYEPRPYGKTEERSTIGRRCRTRCRRTFGRFSALSAE